MNYEETISTLKAIQVSYSTMPFLLDHETEPRFLIDSDSRAIQIPEKFKFLAVKTDHISEKIYFEVDRYFDGEDLSTKACVVQYINAGGVNVEGIYPVTYVDLNTNPDKIIFRWEVDNNVSKYAGMVSFSVRFYTISEDNRFTYSWNTIPATLPVLDTLNNTGTIVSENYPTELVEWNYRMQQLDRTISEKIATATESIDTNTKAAQAARKGAEDAESRVNAIVAGNEAYTKQETHDLFAGALVTQTGPAASLEVYPDKLSNLKVYANGFTQQAGSGDPSPTNVRALTNGGLKLIKYELTGNESYIKYLNGIAFSRVFSGTLNNPKAYCTDFYQISTGNKQQGAFWFGYGDTNVYCFINPEGTATTDEQVQAFKAEVQERYAAGNPITFWYQPADESQATGLYTPIPIQGGEYRANCLELTAPLCEGDSVVSYIKSGCDVEITFDGSEDEAWSVNNASSSGVGGSKRFSIAISSPASNAGNNTIGIAYSDIFLQASSDQVFGVGYENTFCAQNSVVLLRIQGISTVEALREYLAAHPLTVWYRSTNYTEANDIQVSLETHVKAVLVLDGTEIWRTMDEANQFNTSIVNLKNANTLYCTHYKPVKTYWSAVPDKACNGTAGIIAIHDSDFETPDDLKKSLAAQYAAGTPITIVYELATPVTYAHPAVRLPAYPDDTGKVTITGQSGGTVSVEYNKNITKAFEELQSAVLAAIANLSI